jgi:hypothetical protein
MNNTRSEIFERKNKGINAKNVPKSLFLRAFTGRFVAATDVSSSVFKGTCDPTGFRCGFTCAASKALRRLGADGAAAATSIHLRKRHPKIGAMKKVTSLQDIVGLKHRHCVY